MPLSRADQERLSRAGFLDFEIEHFNWAQAPDMSYIEIDLSSATWQAVMRRRRAWIDAMLRQKWSNAQIERAIRKWYEAKRSRNPFDWVKAEYRPPRRISDYQEARRKRAEAEAKRLYKR